MYCWCSSKPCKGLKLLILSPIGTWKLFALMHWKLIIHTCCNYLSFQIKCSHGDTCTATLLVIIGIHLRDRSLLNSRGGWWFSEKRCEKNRDPHPKTRFENSRPPLKREIFFHDPPLLFIYKFARSARISKFFFLTTPKSPEKKSWPPQIAKKKSWPPPKTTGPPQKLIMTGP